MRRIQMIVMAVTFVALTGCAAQSEEALPSTPSTSSVQGDATVFLEQVRTTWAGTIPDDDELLIAGSSACAQLEAGTSHTGVTIFPSDEASSEYADANTRSIVDAAALSLCPVASSE